MTEDLDDDNAQHDAQVDKVLRAIVSLSAPDGLGLDPLAVLEGSIKAAGVVAIRAGCTPAQAADLITDAADVLRQLREVKPQ
jgi:hypothetical protein